MREWKRKLLKNPFTAVLLVEMHPLIYSLTQAGSNVPVEVL